MTYGVGDEAEGRDAVQLDYIKSNLFRVVFIDGVIGSVSPSGMIQLALFSEREAIPRSVRHALNEDGQLGEELGSIRRCEYVREVEVSAMMTKATAVELIEWLLQRVAELDDEEGKS